MSANKPCWKVCVISVHLLKANRGDKTIIWKRTYQFNEGEIIFARSKVRVFLIVAVKEDAEHSAETIHALNCGDECSSDGDLIWDKKNHMRKTNF